MEVYFMQKVAGIANLFKLLEPAPTCPCVFFPSPSCETTLAKYNRDLVYHVYIDMS